MIAPILSRLIVLAFQGNIIAAHIPYRRGGEFTNFDLNHHSVVLLTQCPSYFAIHMTHRPNHFEMAVRCRRNEWRISLGQVAAF